MDVSRGTLRTVPPLESPPLMPSPTKTRRVLCKTLSSLLAVALSAPLIAETGPLTVQSPAQTVARTSITGTIQDPTAAIIPGATVQLLRADRTVLATTTTDNNGRFQLPSPGAGEYSLIISLSGFSTLVRPLHVTRAASAPLSLTMNLASVATDVTVNADQDIAVSDPASNADSASLTSDDMKNLPILDGDVVSMLSAFLDTGAAGEGGPTLVIDGVESKTVGISPSAIERISINQDPYSAQYRQPGRGQVEIVTKNAAENFHGELSFNFRDAALEATNYFSRVKPPSQRRFYEGFVTGPTFLKDTPFLFSFTRTERDYFGQVNATTLPTVLPAQNIPAPSRITQLTMKVNRQYSDHHSGFLLYRFNKQSSTNQNIGGLVQQSAGSTAYDFDMDLTYHDDLTLGTNKLNQFNILFERNLDRIVSNSQAAQVIVEGVATFGGAQQDQFNTENNPNLSDIFSWTLATHIPQQLKFGIQLPNLGRRILDDETNRQGTYTYSSAASYLAGTPQSFSIQTGQSRFETLYAQPGAFVLDIIQLTPRLTVTPGLRYEFQNTIGATKDGFQPRMSIAYVLDQKHKMVVRTGSGIYFRHVGVNISQQVARYATPSERSLLVTTNLTNLCYPPTTTPTNITNAPNCIPLSTEPPSLFRLAPGMQSPVQAYFGLSLEREITRGSTLTVGYSGYRGWHALRSIDINAPLPPFTSATRPDPTISQNTQLSSGGFQASDDLNVSYRGRIGNVFSGFVQYDYSHADADTQWSTFYPQNQYAPNDEWARTDYDQRQRLSLFATIYPDKPVTLGVGFYENTPMPYTITTGTDDFHTGLFNARPAGVARNSVNGGDFQDVQLRLGYTHKFAPLQKSKVAATPDEPQALAFSVSSFNTLNRVNFQNYDGVVGSADFLQPTTANFPRRLQLTVAYNF
jgi:hypothetical protein